MAKGASKMRVLITGTAGFIGFHLGKLLLAEGIVVYGFDGMTNYYDVALKKRRHQSRVSCPLCSLFHSQSDFSFYST